MIAVVDTGPLLVDAKLQRLHATIENRTDIWIRPELCARVRQTQLAP